MPADRRIREEITSLITVQNLVQTYEEIAAIRMQRVKASVLNNRDFLSSLLEIYRQVRFSYEKEIKETGAKPIKKRTGGAVHVLLSANTGLYGDIIHRSFDLFIKGIEGKAAEVDIVVVGRIGRQLFEAVRENLGVSSYKYFDLPDSTSDPSDFVEIVAYIAEYSSVVVYHGQFESILTQKAIKEELSGQLPPSEVSAAEMGNYIFEPSLEKIVGFFESEILASVFEQSMYESSLGKYAARMINLDRAVVNIDRILGIARQDAQKSSHRDANRKQLSLLSSSKLWNI
jgi:ATP synthase F1 gamma subunit